MGQAQAATLLMAAAGVSSDPSFSSVKMLLHFDGTNGSTTFTDSSSLAANPTNTLNCSLTTTGPLYGTACLNCAAGRITAADNVAYQIGTGDFCVDVAQNYGALGGFATIFDYNNDAFDIYRSGSTLFFYANGADRITATAALTAAQYDKIRVARVSGTTRMYVNGTQVGSSYTDSNSYAHGAINIGGEHDGTLLSTATFDEIRLTVGVGRSSGSSYVVDTAAFPNS